MFNAIKATKLVVSGIVGIGAGKIVGQIIKNNTSPENLIDRVTMLAAGWTIAGMVAKASEDFTDRMVDDAVTTAGKVKSYLVLKEKLGRINRKESTFEKEGLLEEMYEQDKKGKWHPKKIEDAVIVEDEN